MEPIQVFDEGTQAFLTVYVAKEVVQKCRADNSFAEDLYAQIRDQEVEEGSILEIQTELVEKAADVVEVTADFHWSKKETLNLFKLYRMHCNNFPGTPKKKSFWITLSKELAKRKIEKSPEECIEKWKNLIKIYKASMKTPNSFPYFKEVDDIVKSNMEVTPDFSEAETSIDEGSTLPGDAEKDADSKEMWSKSETRKFLDILKKKGIKKPIRNDQFWVDVSEALAKEEIFKAPVKCVTKWRNLVRAFRTVQFKGNTKTRFRFYHEVEEILKEDDFPEDFEMGGTEEEDNCLEFDSNSEMNAAGDEPSLSDDGKHQTDWSDSETLKLIDLYNQHRYKYADFPIKNEFWNIIAEELKKEGYKNKNGVMCRDRLRNLIVSCTNSDGNKSKFAKAMEDILMYDPEGEEEYMKNALKPKWTRAETVILLKTYQDQLAGSPDSAPDWSGISNQLSSRDFFASPDDCRRRWEHLLSIYRMHKDLDLANTKFVHFDAVDRIVRCQPKKIEKEATVGCLCRSELGLNKANRHRDRMELMQRKLDIEERKVAAFEEYLKLMKGDKSESV